MLKILINGVNMEISEEKCNGEIYTYIRGFLTVRGLNYCMEHITPLHSSIYEGMLIATKVAESLLWKRAELLKELDDLDG